MNRDKTTGKLFCTANAARRARCMDAPSELILMIGLGRYLIAGGGVYFLFVVTGFI